MTNEQLRALILPDTNADEKFVFVIPELVEKFGYKEASLLSRLVFLTGKGHAPDGYIYKTYSELWEELRIPERTARRIVERLERAGVLEVVRRRPRGPDGRVCGPSPMMHYRVDLEELARQVGFVLTAHEEDFEEDFEDETFEDETLNLESNAATLAGTDRPLCLVQPGHSGRSYIQRDARETSENSPLQGAAEPAFAEPAAPEINGNKHPKREPQEPLGGDKRHSRQAPTAAKKAAAREDVSHIFGDNETEQRQLSGETKHKVWSAFFSEQQNELTRMADAYIDGRGASLGDVARAAREVAGTSEDLDLFMEWVKGCLEEKRLELEAV